MLEDILVAKIWLALVIWSALYVSDYGLTIYGAWLPPCSSGRRLGERRPMIAR